MFDDAASPPANWILQLLEEIVNLEKVIGTKFTQVYINRFWANEAKPIYRSSERKYFKVVSPLLEM